MKAFNPYLNFDGNTREAMTFYNACVDGELVIQMFGDVKAPGPPGSENRVMHARISKGSAILMASDTFSGMPDSTGAIAPSNFKPGNNVWISIECETVAEIEKLFAAWGEGGKVVMPLQDQFWGARFGMLTDKFGVNWMFNCELPKKS